MNTSRRPLRLHTLGDWTASQAAALRQIVAAAERVDAVKTPDTLSDLHDAVDSAREVGVGWTKIGDTLGIASGNAYQRYRKRPSPFGRAARLAKLPAPEAHDARR